MDFKILNFDEIDSTNLYIMNNELSVGTVVTARYQNAGIGRNGRNWESGEGNLFFSIRLPIMELNKLFGVQIVMGYAIVEAIRKYLNVGLKWPNDIYFNGKKVGGLLIQTQFAGNKLKKLIFGAGINIKSAPKDFTTATSIYSACGLKVEKDELLESILKNIGLFYYGYVAKNIDISELWSKYSENINKELSFHYNGEKIKAVEMGITEEGFLIARDGLKNDRVITGGEIGYDFSV